MDVDYQYLYLNFENQVNKIDDQLDIIEDPI